MHVSMRVHHCKEIIVGDFDRGHVSVGTAHIGVYAFVLSAGCV
jgi:hypothetical protein